MKRALFSLATFILATSCFAVALSVVSLADAPQARQTGAATPAGTQYRASLEKYCVTCHNQRLKTAGLALDTLNLAEVPAHAETWEKVIRKLRTGLMPPAGLPRPEPAAVAHRRREAVERAS